MPVPRPLQPIRASWIVLSSAAGRPRAAPSRVVRRRQLAGGLQELAAGWRCFVAHGESPLRIGEQPPTASSRQTGWSGGFRRREFFAWPREGFNRRGSLATARQTGRAVDAPARRAGGPAAAGMFFRSFDRAEYGNRLRKRPYLVRGPRWQGRLRHLAEDAGDVSPRARQAGCGSSGGGKKRAGRPSRGIATARDMPSARIAGAGPSCWASRPHRPVARLRDQASRAALTRSTTAVKPSGSWIANSESILRSNSIRALARPLMNWL